MYYRLKLTFWYLYAQFFHAYCICCTVTNPKQIFSCFVSQFILIEQAFLVFLYFIDENGNMLEEIYSGNKSIFMHIINEYRL